MFKKPVAILMFNARRTMWPGLKSAMETPHHGNASKKDS